jgi:glycosyltransferase involved in cell wall biosynthesis
MRICVVSEELASPLDEGFKKFSWSLIKALSAQHQVLALSKWGLCDQECLVEKAPMNRLLLNWSLWRRIARFAPEIICYVPSSSGTFNSFLRAHILKWYGGGARVILVSLQPRDYSPLQARWIPRLRPDVVLVQSHQSAQALEELGCLAHVLPSGVELDRFTPISESHKNQLRRQYGLPSDAFLVLHVGHINTRRGVRIFKELQGEPGIQVLLVGSTSTPQDEELMGKLENAGVRVIRDYIPNIQEVYQLSDCYLFQVSSKEAAIELPLSVLEAMACNLPVIATRYGGLADFFPEDDGLLFAETRGEMLDKISLVKEGLPSRTRAMVEAFSWENVLKMYLQDYLR